MQDERVWGVTGVFFSTIAIPLRFESDGDNSALVICRVELDMLLHKRGCRRVHLEDDVLAPADGGYAGASAGNVPRGRPFHRGADILWFIALFNQEPALLTHAILLPPWREREQARHASTAAGCEAKWGMTSCAKRSIMRRVSVWL